LGRTPRSVGWAYPYPRLTIPTRGIEGVVNKPLYQPSRQTTQRETIGPHRVMGGGGQATPALRSPPSYLSCQRHSSCGLVSAGGQPPQGATSWRLGVSPLLRTPSERAPCGLGFPWRWVLKEGEVYDTRGVASHRKSEERIGINVLPFLESGLSLRSSNLVNCPTSGSSPVSPARLLC
jgi:hypothetical protein